MSDLPADMVAALKKIPRDQARLQAECKVRLKHGITVLTEQNRLKFLLLAEAELHPESVLGKFVKDAIWNDSHCFDGLTPLATIDRDNRDIEKIGLFSKEKSLPEVVQQMKL